MVEEIKLTNKKTCDSVLIDKVQSSYVLGEADFGTVESAHQTSKYPGQIGETKTNSTLGIRQVSISGWVIGPNEDIIKSLKSILNRMINPLDTLTIEYSDYKLNMVPSNSIKYSVSYQENNEVLCKFLISGKCFDPMFADAEPDNVLAAAEYGQFHFPLCIPEEGISLSYRTPSLMVTINNKGDIETGVRIVFEATGKVVNPSIVNVDTQESIKINKTMSTGEKIIVNTIDGEESVRGIVENEDSNYYSYFDIDSKWLQMKLGDNLIAYNAESGIDNLNITITYNNKYLEVQ